MWHVLCIISLLCENFQLLLICYTFIVSEFRSIVFLCDDIFDNDILLNHFRGRGW